MPIKPTPVRVRFEAKYQIDDVMGCWLWIGAIRKAGGLGHGGGYGRLWDGRKVQYAHVVAYELFKGQKPEGTEIDHLCRIRHCVNPDHLEAVTRQVNQLRGDGAAGRNARKTQCKQGHPFVEGNIYWYRGQRRCSTCARRWAREARMRNSVNGH